MGNVISFYGADHKCGTSMIAQSVAEYIASCTEKNVMLVHACEGSGEEYSPMVHESMENIRPYLSNRLINISSVMEKCRYKDNLYIMGGASRPASAGSFSPDMAGYLFESLSSDFEYVICDVGSELDHALSIGSLCKSDYVYIVLTQSEHAVRRLEWVSPLFEKLNIPRNAIVINRYEKDEVNDVGFIKERTGIKNVFCIKQSRHGKKAEYDSKTLLAIKDAKFAKDISAVAGDILERCAKAENSNRSAEK